jgi:hypothetical protein
VLLTDDEGIVLARIFEPLGLKITQEELKARRDHQGGTYTTPEVHDHLERRCHTNFLPREEFRVEWLPQARNDLEAICAKGNTPPTHRHRAALMKFYKEAFNSIDPELRAWATLSSRWGDEGHVLIVKRLAVLFRVFPERFVVLVEHVEQAG